jgi:branched-chain amino acid transport system substrate-binding protein
MGIDAWVAEHGKKVGDHEIEFIYRDEESPNPAKSKALAQELLVKDKVQYLAGLYFTPDAMAVAPLLEESKTPMIVLNAATSAIVEKSPYIVRTSFTMWQNTVPAAKVASKNGSKKVAIAVSDYGPGVDAETAFKKTFEADGGTITEAIRMPLNTTDFSPIMQRIKDSGADTIFTFLPAGPPTLGFVKAYIDNGLKAAGVKLMSTGDVVTEPDLPNIGDSGIGILSTYHYAVSHDSPENKAFLAQIVKNGGKLDEVTMTSVAAYDGARLIYKMIEATGGQRDPEKAVAAVKGMKWVSPRGPVSIDPDTRHIRQNVYLREVSKQDGKLVNKELQTFEAQPDWALSKN